jgi:GT2 family glycosyltransferase
MRILMLSEHCCIRVKKQADALMRAGHFVAHICSRVANAELEGEMSWTMKFHSEQQLRDKLEDVGNSYDVIHVHNEPSSLVTIARECCPTSCIIYDAHDLDLCRYDRMTADEAAAAISASGMILPSQTYARMAIDRMKLTVPTMTIYSHLTEDMREGIKRRAHHGGLVYEGACRINSRLGYCDYQAVAKRCNDHDIPFTVVQADNVNQREYQDVGAVVVGPLNYRDMLSALTRYDYGLCAPGKLPSLQWERTVPNKLYEYIAAGIPVITWPDRGEVAAIIKRNNIGIVLSGPDKLDADMWAACVACRPSLMPQVLAMRAQWTMESQTDSILTLYREALARRPVRGFTVPPDPVLSIVIATHDRFEHLVAAIDSARASCETTIADGTRRAVSWEIIAVDGGSSDHTLKWLRAQPDVRLIAQGKRVGAVAAYNAGFAAARGRYVAALNDDCECVGPVLVESCRCLDSVAKVGQIAIPWKDPGEPEPHIAHEDFLGRSWAYANFSVTRRELGEKVCWWGTDYFHYAGDAELSMRLWDAGHPVASVEGGGYIMHAREQKGRVKNTDSKKFRDKWMKWKGPEVLHEPQQIDL